MPYQVYRENNGRHCVHKENSDGSKGKQIGCHATRTKANAQMRALYANESKEGTTMPNEANTTTITTNADPLSTTPYMGEEIKPEEQEQEQQEETKEAQEETEEKHDTYYADYVPWGVISFAALSEAQDARAAALQVKTLSDQLVEMTSNIMYSSEVEDKPAALSALSDEYKALINAEADNIKEVNWLDQVKETVTEAITSLFSKEEPQEQSPGRFMLWKEEGGGLRWFTRYSNNFRDDDSPPEIISSNSHRRFVEMVDRKEAPLPELWLWHEPGWKLGEADWLAYDDSGFALASGTIDRGKEMVAEQIAKAKLVGVSHGMPVSSIKREQDNPTVIVEHETREISPLPPTRAANKLGEWILLGSTEKEGNNMPIPDQKKQDLLERWKIDAEVLEQLEALNADDANKASEEGRESKETTEEEKTEETKTKDEVAAEEETTTESEEEETTTEEEETPALNDEEPITREEIAAAITTVLKPYMDVVVELRGEVKELRETDEEKIVKATKLTPTASVSALLAQQFSAIGDKSTNVARNSKLAKDAPEEAEIEQVSPIPFINTMIVGENNGE